MSQGQNEQDRPRLSRLERGFCDAADFDTEFMMSGFLHPFIYRAERISNVIWFLDAIGAAQTAQPVRHALLAFTAELGQPEIGSYGDSVFDVVEGSEHWQAQCETWAEAYLQASYWGTLFEAVLIRQGVKPDEFWST